MSKKRLSKESHTAVPIKERIMLKIVNHTYGLNFKDVQKYLPQLTIDNEVATNGAILHLEILYNQQSFNLFVDNPYATILFQCSRRRC